MSQQDIWLEKWNERYDEAEFAYGEEPNQFFKTQLDKINPGKILLGAEGEGRNAVYAATKGWQAAAFDISTSGKKKADELADRNKVVIDYRVGQLEDLNFEKESFDVIALIFAHFPSQIKSKYHLLLKQYLKKGGVVIFEAFGKNHLEYNSKNPEIGGPKNVDDLFSVGELKADFNDFEFIELAEKEVELNEGLFHIGKGSVVQFMGRKIA